MDDTKRARRAGFWAAFGAFTAWGLIPVYWKSVGAVPPLELLCHRIVWSTVFLSLILTLQGGWQTLGATLRSSRTVRLSALSGTVIGFNWLLYIWAVNSNQVLETSLGYYMNPLLNVLLGRVFFGERLRRLQIVGLVLAAAGVATLTIRFGQFPWVGLTLASTFAFYGALRKIAKVEAIAGQWMETAFLGIAACLYLLWLQRSGTGALATASGSLKLLLSASGVVTSLPLVGFAFSVRRLRLSTVGILQYIAPTLNFGLGVFLYKEPFTPGHLLAFGLIWLGVAAYTAEALWAAQRPGVTPA